MKDNRIFINKNNAEYKAEINGKWIDFDFVSPNTVDEVLSLRPNVKFIGRAERFLSNLGRETSMNEQNIFLAGNAPDEFYVSNRFTEREVRELMQTIYSEFVELSSTMQTPYCLRRIIENELEQHPVKPIKIFND